MINNERMDSWTAKSWLDELSSDARLAKDLTSIYADDVLQSVADKDFSNLNDAIAAYQVEAGLTTADVVEVRKVIIAKTEPESFIAEHNIRKAKKSDLAELLKLATTICEKCEKAPCECAHTLSSPVARAINRIGLETLAEMCDKAEMDTPEKEEKKDEERLKEAEASAPVELTAEANRIKELMASGATATEAMEKSAKGMNPGFQAYLDKKKEEKKGKEGETSKADEKDEKKEASLKDKAINWAKFLESKGYFQGAEQPSVEGKVTSNNPETLGYGSKEGVHYDLNALETKGGPVRNEEQKAFEGAATETKKVMGPSGEELKVKELWQRAKYMAAIKRAREEAKKKV